MQTVRRFLIVGAVVVASTCVGVGVAGAAWSPAGSGTAFAKATSLAPPVPGSATTACSAGNKASVTFSWPAVDRADSYAVAEGNKPGKGQTGTTYTDSSVNRGTTYNYVVRSVRSNWQSVNSSTVTVTTPSNC